MRFVILVFNANDWDLSKPNYVVETDDMEPYQEGRCLWGESNDGYVQEIQKIVLAKPVGDMQQVSIFTVSKRMGQRNSFMGL